MLRKLKRKLPEIVMKSYEDVFKTYLKMLTQRTRTKDRVYSLHKAQIACIGKTKAGKNYEFKTKLEV